MPDEYTDYNHVPWYRRYERVNLLVLVGFFVFPPLLWAACILCLTGEIYTDELDQEGILTRCPASIKVAAFFALLSQAVLIAYAVRTILV